MPGQTNATVKCNHDYVALDTTRLFCRRCAAQVYLDTEDSKRSPQLQSVVQNRTVITRRYVPYSDKDIEEQFKTQWQLLGSTVLRSDVLKSLEHEHKFRTPTILLGHSKPVGDAEKRKAADELLKWRNFLDWLVRQDGELNKRYTWGEFILTTTFDIAVLAFARRNGPAWTTEVCRKMLQSRWRNHNRRKRSLDPATAEKYALSYRRGAKKRTKHTKTKSTARMEPTGDLLAEDVSSVVGKETQLPQGLGLMSLLQDSAQLSSPGDMMNDGLDPESDNDEAFAKSIFKVADDVQSIGERNPDASFDGVADLTAGVADDSKELLAAQLLMKTATRLAAKENAKDAADARNKLRAEAQKTVKDAAKMTKLRAAVIRAAKDAPKQTELQGVVGDKRGARAGKSQSDDAVKMAMLRNAVTPKPKAAKTKKNKKAQKPRVVQPYSEATKHDVVIFARSDPNPMGVGILIALPKKGKWTIQWMGNAKNDEDCPFNAHYACWVDSSSRLGYYAGERKNRSHLPMTERINRTMIRGCVKLDEEMKVPKAEIQACFPELLI